jgi:hypothetical protein
MMTSDPNVIKDLLYVKQKYFKKQSDKYGALSLLVGKNFTKIR